jgi:phosphodiesterase/alkaline phosphatase D-like protein
MPEKNGMTMSRKYAERMTKVRVPIKEPVDWLKGLDEFRKRYGLKLTPEEVNRILHERFGE